MASYTNWTVPQTKTGDRESQQARVLALDKAKKRGQATWIDILYECYGLIRKYMVLFNLFGGLFMYVYIYIYIDIYLQPLPLQTPSETVFGVVFGV